MILQALPESKGIAQEYYFRAALWVRNPVAVLSNRNFYVEFIGNLSVNKITAQAQTNWGVDGHRVSAEIQIPDAGRNRRRITA